MTQTKRPEEVTRILPKNCIFLGTQRGARILKTTGRDFIANRWATLKVVAARDSPEYEARPVIADDTDIAGSRLRKYWLDGPNGRDLCLVLPVLGPGLSRLSKPIFSRLKPEFSRLVSLQATQANAQLHSERSCHGEQAETIQAHGSQRSQPEWHEEAAQGQ
ncbi:hypothetical protein MCOR09_002937 [Pyricularia oryzae]|nr:hypothetical protein MCOR09_002937 [Pyricularia oryzae]